MSTEQITFSKQEFRLDFLEIEVRQQALRELQVKLFEGGVDTRDALADFAPNVDIYQRRVIEAAEHTIRLIAPPGSGKTQTLVNRVLTNIRNGISAKNTVILTFDTTGVSSLRSKFRDELTRSRLNLEQTPAISTISAFGYALLREYVPDEFKSVAPEYRKRRLLREVKDALYEISPERFNLLPTVLQDRFYLEFFSLLKNETFDPRNPDAQALANFMLARTEASAPFFSSTNPEIVVQVIQAVIWLYMAYELAMQREKLIDIDDQKLRAYLALRGDTMLLRRVQDRYSEIIVDEFQEINRLDFVLIAALAAESRLIVAGDDDQAIYGFRGCSPDYLINLGTYLERRVATFELSMNYRCPPNIVEHATRLIKYNRNRIEKSPIAHRKEPAAIKVISSLSAGLEAKLVVSYIRRVLHANPGLLFKDMAVLYRTNAQSLPLQVEFVLNDILYYVREEDNIVENRVLERLLATLRVKLALRAGQQPTGNDAVLLTQAYFTYVAPEDVEPLLILFNRGGRLLDTLSSDAFFNIMPKARHSNFLTALKSLVQAKSLMETLDVMARGFNGLSGMVGSLEDVVAERVPLGEIFELAANFAGNTEDFVRTMDRALTRARQTKAGTNRDAGVGLLTYLRAKGLQWHTVVLTGCNEGLIPHKRGYIDDERRLFYVAMTRASSNLFISYVKNVCRTQVEPSRFLREAGLI